MRPQREVTENYKLSVVYKMNEPLGTYGDPKALFKNLLEGDDIDIETFFVEYSASLNFKQFFKSLYIIKERAEQAGKSSKASRCDRIFTMAKAWAPVIDIPLSL
jgi:hypothetical protein